MGQLRKRGAISCIDAPGKAGISNGMIKPMHILVALLMLLTGPVAAQQRHPVLQPVLAQPAPRVLKPALWKLVDADTTIYLFGTIHALPKDLVWLDGPLATALESSDELVTEILPPQQDALQALVLRRALLPKGQSLRSILTGAQYQAYASAMQANRMPAVMFDRFKPWYVAVALTTLPLLRDGYAVENGVEQQLAARMQALGKQHSALETIEFQLAMFDDLPPETQRKFLLDVVAGQGELRAQLDLMVTEWGQGSAVKLAEMLNDDNEDPATKAALFTNRNRDWTGWIGQRMARPGTVFMAVGAGHLAGQDSVLDMLEQQGQLATRVQ